MSMCCIYGTETVTKNKSKNNTCVVYSYKLITVDNGCTHATVYWVIWEVHLILQRAGFNHIDAIYTIKSPASVFFFSILILLKYTKNREKMKIITQIYVSAIISTKQIIV